MPQTPPPDDWNPQSRFEPDLLLRALRAKLATSVAATPTWVLVAFAAWWMYWLARGIAKTDTFDIVFYICVFAFTLVMLLMKVRNRRP